MYPFFCFFFLILINLYVSLFCMCIIIRSISPHLGFELLICLIISDLTNALMKYPLRGDRPYWINEKVREFWLTCGNTINNHTHTHTQSQSNIVFLFNHYFFYLIRCLFLFISFVLIVFSFAVCCC